MATVSPAPAAPEWPPATSGGGPAATGRPLRPPAADWSGDPAAPRDPLPKGLPPGTARATADLPLAHLPEKRCVARSSLVGRRPSPGGPRLPIPRPALPAGRVALPHASRAGPARARIGETLLTLSTPATAKGKPSPEPLALSATRSGPGPVALEAVARRFAGETARAAQL